MNFRPSIAALQGLGKPSSQASAGAAAGATTIVPDSTETVVVRKEWFDATLANEKQDQWLGPLTTLFALGAGFSLGAVGRSDGAFGGMKMMVDDLKRWKEERRKGDPRDYRPVSQARFNDMIRVERGQSRDYGSAADAVSSSPSSYRLSQR